MEKDILEISYSDLRKIYSEVIAFVEKEADWFTNPNRKVKIEEDLGLYGLDNESFLWEFSKKFNVDFSEMDYRKYLTEEIEIVNMKWVILFPFLIIYLLIKWFLVIISFPISRSFSKRTENYDIPIIRNSIKKDVTIGDLIVSAIKNKFWEEEKVAIQLKTS